MLEPEELDQVIELARARLASGAGFDEVLAGLKERGVHKMESMRIMREATGLGLGEIRPLVHESPVWADRRASDEACQDWFVRSLFVLAVLGEADISAPAEDVAECDDRRHRGGAGLLRAASGLPGEALRQFHELMDDGLLGRAFTELVAVARNHDAGDQCWQSLAVAAEVLLLFEDLGEEEPADTEDWVWAAWEARRRFRLTVEDAK